MTWAEFVVVVDSHLAVEATRRGLETFRSRYIQNCIIDLQRYIRSYRDANKNIYSSGDVAVESHAHLVPLPSGAKVKACYIYSVATDADQLCERHRLGYYPWQNRQDLVCGRLNFLSWWGGCWPIGGCPTTDSVNVTDFEKKAHVYSMSPMSRNLLIYPQLTVSTRLMVVWDGIKTSFSDDDEINFPIDAAEAVASYVLWKITVNVDKNPQLAQLHAADYSRLRLALYRDFQESLDVSDNDQEFDANLNPNVNPLFGFGAQDIPFLSVVTQLEGVTNAALANLPTSAITTPYILQVEIGGEVQTWVIMTSTAANDPTNGVLRFNDYSVTNTKVAFMNSV